MATIKQKKAIEKIVENGGNISRAMMDVGYSKNTAHSPSKLLDSKGFMELMEELGLTDDLIIGSLVDDIKSKPGNRIAELQLAVKMKGRITDKLDLGGKIDVVTGTADPVKAIEFAEYLRNKS